MAEQLLTSNRVLPRRAQPADFTPTKDIFSDSMTHRLLVAFNQPTYWPLALGMLVAALLVAVAGGIWWWCVRLTAVALSVAGIQVLFMLGDAAILWLLSRRRISFGPRRAQLLVLATPRLLATVVLGAVAVWTGWPLALALTTLLQLVGTAAFYWGAAVEPAHLQMTQQTIRSDRMAGGTPPIRLLHISDIHLERLSRREKALLGYVAKVQPDLIVITGDYISTSYNGDPHALFAVRQFLSRLSAPYGVYATLGTPPADLRDKIVPLFNDLPVTLLREDWQLVNLDKGRELVIMGMDCTHYLPDDIARLGRIVATAPRNSPQLLLNHSPELMPQAVEHGIDLYLCGHTHGGQVRLPLIGPLLTSSQLGRRYVMGLYKEARTHLYVSRGVGFEGMSAPRVRFLTRPEITLFTIMPQ